MLKMQKNLKQSTNIYIDVITEWNTSMAYVFNIETIILAKNNITVLGIIYNEIRGKTYINDSIKAKVCPTVEVFAETTVGKMT